VDPRRRRRAPDHPTGRTALTQAPVADRKARTRHRMRAFSVAQDRESVREQGRAILRASNRIELRCAPHCHTTTTAHTGRPCTCGRAFNPLQRNAICRYLLRYSWPCESEQSTDRHYPRKSPRTPQSHCRSTNYTSPVEEAPARVRVVRRSRRTLSLEQRSTLSTGERGEKMLLGAGDDPEERRIVVVGAGQDQTTLN
jgi:hypothetical protein